MPYPNNLDIYDFSLAIFQAETLCHTANKKKKFYEKKLKKATVFFRKHKKNILKFGVVVKIDNKTIDSRGKIADTTHEKYYKNDFETFICEINNAINNLWWHIELENAMTNCNKEKNIEKKLCAYIKLKKKYENFLWEIDITLKENNPKEYEIDKILYTKQLKIIENRITELLDRQKKCSSSMTWIKRIFKASKIKTPIFETDLGKI